MPYFIYLLRCVDGSIYVGHTSNLRRRLKDHFSANGAVHTGWHPARHLLHTEQFETRAEACKRERQIKKWSRAKKEALAAGDLQTVHTLAARQESLAKAMKKTETQQLTEESSKKLESTAA